MAGGLTPSSALRLIELGSRVGFFVNVSGHAGRFSYEVSTPHGRRFSGRNHSSWSKAEKWAAHMVRLELKKFWKKYDQHRDEDCRGN